MMFNDIQYIPGSLRLHKSVPFEEESRYGIFSKDYHFCDKLEIGKIVW